MKDITIVILIIIGTFLFYFLAFYLIFRNSKKIRKMEEGLKEKSISFQKRIVRAGSIEELDEIWDEFVENFKVIKYTTSPLQNSILETISMYTAIRWRFENPDKINFSSQDKI